jgi:hypothetical protein
MITGPRRLVRAAPLVAAMAALVLAAGCQTRNFGPQPGAGIPPCRWDRKACPDRGTGQPTPPPADTTLPTPPPPSPGASGSGI